MVAPIYFARLVTPLISLTPLDFRTLTDILPFPQATKRALLLMDRDDHTSDTAPFKLRPVNGGIKDTLYFI